MKTLTKMIAAVLTASLAVCAAAPVNAALTDIPSDTVVAADDSANTPTFTSDEEMLKYIRAQMAQRNESFSVMRKGAREDEMRYYTDLTLQKVFDYTGVPTEGSYLQLNVRNYASSVSAVNGGLKIAIKVKYITTSEQEAELDVQVKKLVSAMPLILGANYESLPDAEKVAKGYDYFVRLMKNVSYINDNSDPELSSAYSVLVKNSANELGYLQLFIRALAEIGIESKAYCTNIDLTESLDAHYLAAVCVDGTYYLCDPVWDFLSGSASGGKDNKFLLKGMNDIDSDIGSASEYKHKHADLGVTVNEIAAKNGLSLYSYDKKFEFGDVSDDGLIDSVDASMILAEYARLSTADKYGIFSAGQKTAADVDKNGRIDSVDTSAILSYYAYKSTKSDNTTLSEFINRKK